MTTTAYLGSYEDHGRRLSVWADLDIDPVSGHGQTVDHQPIPADAVEIALSSSVYDTTGTSERTRFGTRFVSGGQDVDSVRRVAPRLAELWDAWHLNDLTPGCVHQGESWTCTRDLDADARDIARRIGADVPPERPCGTLNGWPVIRELFGEHPYPRRGDTCYQCGRHRWDEPTDHCPVTGYRYGSAWLYRVPPAAVVDELRAIFGVAPDPDATAARIIAEAAEGDPGELGEPPMHEGAVLIGGTIPRHYAGAYPRLSCCGGPVLLSAMHTTHSEATR